jgi:two-component system nitrate/nitrite response regulator NarL
MNDAHRHSERGIVMTGGVAGERSKRVLIADPQPIFRLGLVAALASAHPDWNVAESDTLEAHLPQLWQGSADLLIVDSRLLGIEAMHGLPIGGGDTTRWVDIVAVTEPGDAIGALGCLRAGAHATISRADPVNRTLETIGMLSMRRQHDALPGSGHASAVATKPQSPDSPEHLKLTTRQFDVLRLLAKGHSNKVIARDLGLSVSTVKVHLNTVFRALGASNRLEAVIRARPFQVRMSQQVG